MASQHPPATLFKASLIAGIAGAGIALLLAPRSGRATRYQLRNNLLKIEQFGKKSLSRRYSAPDNSIERLKAWDTQHRQAPALTKWEEEV